MTTTRTSLKLTDERQRRLDRAAGIVARDDYDDPPMSKVIDAALIHLLESHKNAEDYREDLQHGRTDVSPADASDLLSTPVMTLRYRTDLETSR